MEKQKHLIVIHTYIGIVFAKPDENQPCFAATTRPKDLGRYPFFFNRITANYNESKTNKFANQPKFEDQTNTHDNHRYALEFIDWFADNVRIISAKVYMLLLGKH